MLDGCWFLHLSALHADRNGQAQRSRSQRLARRHPDRAGRANHLSPFKAANLVFAAGLGLLALAATPLVLFAGWAVIGLGMGIGLYETGFATLAGIYGKDARGPITGITLIARIASTVGWPLSGLMLATWGWREACLGWALIHLAVALPLNAWLPKGTKTAAGVATPVEDGPPPSRLALCCWPSSLPRPGSTRPPWPRICQAFCRPPGPARLSPSRQER